MRAVAVLSVVAFHAGLGLKGGFLGVDVFFVISGYLITNIIQKDLDAGSFSLAGFWERRVRRIFPALAVTVLATLLAGCFLLLPHELEELGKSSLAQAFLVANFYFWRDTGYFAGPAELKPLLHTWSLAVEEQFYLFYPFVLLLLRKQSATKRYFLIFTITVVSLLMCVYGARYHPSSTFFLLPTRAWELLAGGLVAIKPWRAVASRLQSEFLCGAGVVLVVIAICFFSEETKFPYLLPVLGTVAIFVGTDSACTPLLARLLSLRPFVFIGQLSYSIYLWHWPAIVFTRIRFGQLGWREIIFALTLTFVMSVISWRLVEGVIRKKVILGARRSLFVSSAVVWFLMIGTSIAFCVSGGLPGRFPSELSTLMTDAEWTGVASIPYGSAYTTKDLVAVGIAEESGPSESKPDFFIWGDSHAAVLTEALSLRARELELTGFASVSGGQIPIPGVARMHTWLSIEDQLKARDVVMSFIESKKPQNLVLIARWSWYVEGYQKNELDNNSALVADDYFLTDGADGMIGSQERNMRLIEKNFRRLVQLCNENSITIWVVQQVPETHESTAAKNLFLHRIGRRSSLPDSRSSQEEHAQRQSRIDRILKEHASENVRFVDLAGPLFDRDGHTMNYQDRRAIYRDGDHLTKWGVEQVSPILDSILTQIADRRNVAKKLLIPVEDKDTLQPVP